MADNWYYVQKGNRHGPVAIAVIEAMLSKQELKSEDFVWKKGFENWKKVKDVDEFNGSPTSTPASIQATPAAPVRVEYKELKLTELNPQEFCLYIRIGLDRNATPVEYGPFSAELLRRLFNENRINARTAVFSPGMKEWKLLGDVADFQQFFGEAAPALKDIDRKSVGRKPLLVKANSLVGMARDLTIGGMQVMTADFKGQPGENLALKLHPENSDYHVVLNGQVVRLLEGNSGFMFRFTNLSEEARRVIEKYLQEI